MDQKATLPPELEKFWRIDDGLTACQRAEAYGIDLSLLEENLRLTPLERIRRNDSIVNELNSLRNKFTIAHARS
ncbi:MAG: hypothetical protein LBH01_02935 [Verrucomicrobiales bacterium]|nr:hypothetical protein [Verrucomicrobiales bacterium]